MFPRILERVFRYWKFTAQTVYPKRVNISTIFKLKNSKIESTSASCYKRLKKHSRYINKIVYIDFNYPKCIRHSWQGNSKIFKHTEISLVLANWIEIENLFNFLVSRTITTWYFIPQISMFPNAFEHLYSQGCIKFVASLLTATRKYLRKTCG